METNFSASKLKIDLQAIVDNYNILNIKTHYTTVASVIKANAYGLGVEEIAPILRTAGCNDFFVATIDEALVVRKILPKKCKIAVFNGVLKGEEDVFARYDIQPVLNSVEQVNLWIEHTKKTQIKLPCMIHVDSGMNRLGITLHELEKLVNNKTIKKINLKMVLSHLACADEPNNNMNIEQLNIVNKIRELLPKTPTSFANSYGIFLGKEYYFEMVRPGIALYGGNPTPGKSNPMKPVVNLTSNIMQVRNIDSPQTVGYGATRKLKKGSRIAILPVGYADGYFRNLGNIANCAIDGHKIPVVGRVSMDLITIDITSIKDSVNVGDEVEILGNTIKLDYLAAKANTIDYEILTSLGSRYKRVYTK